MMRAAPHILGALGLAALVLIAGRASAQQSDSPQQSNAQGTVVQPTAEAAPGSPAPGSTIQWNQPRPPAGAAPAPSSPGTPGTVTPSAPPPGATKLPPGTVVPPPDSANSGGIRWNTPQPGAPTPGPGGVPGAPVGPAVNWRSGFQGGVIWVEVIDPASFYRVERIDLVAPDGQVFAAHEITRTQARYDYRADDGTNVGAWGGSHHSGVGVGVGFPLNGRGVEREDSATHSVARFQLADPRMYRRTAANWSVLVRLVDHNGHPSVARFPAPRPTRY